MSVILFIIILGILIFAHELGHFLAAKKFKIRVDEFALGFPPRIWAKKIGETVYALNIVPIGGYVKIYGEDGDEEESKDKKPEKLKIGDQTGKKMSDIPRYKQAVILGSGILGNIIFAWLILSIGFMIGLPTSSGGLFEKGLSNQKLIITSVMPSSPAEISGFKAGDQILSINYNDKNLSNPDSDMASSFISETPSGSAINFNILRNKATTTITSTTKEGLISENKSGIGIGMEYVGILKLNPLKSLVAGGYATVNMTKQVFIGLYNLIANALSGHADFSSITGPIGIANLVGDAEKIGLINLLLLTALISINLAVINFVPFPALDGGRLLFLVIEGIIRKPLNVKFTQRANQIGFVLLLLLMAVITYKDIIKLIK